MDRGALLLYLKNIRDLEFAKVKINTMYDRERRSYKCHKNGLDKTEYKRYVNYRESTVIVLAMFAGMVIAGGLLVNSFAKKLGFLKGIVSGISQIAIWGGVIVAFIALMQFLIGLSEKQEVEEYNREKKREYENNRSKSEELSRKWNMRKAFLETELKKVNALLERNYSINIIPSQYRNVQSIYYIYEYMSTSQASLNETLMHEHMENGIQRILAKLDVIIAQNEYIIFQNRLNEINNQKMIDQNKKMLSSLKQAERNTAIAAQYAEISANYSEANAYFSLANYLKK